MKLKQLLPVAVLSAALVVSSMPALADDNTEPPSHDVVTSESASGGGY